MTPQLTGALLVLTAIFERAACTASGLRGTAGLQSPPSTPSFSASITLHPFNGSQQVDFRDVKVHFDTVTGVSMFECVRRNFDFVGPAFAHLWTRQVCDANKCTVQYNNGTSCGDGKIANFQTFFSLWKPLFRNGVYQHTMQVSGQSCQKWVVEIPSVGWMALCLGANGVPRSAIFQPTAAVGSSNVGSYSQNMTFHNIRIGSGSEAAGIKPLSCNASKETVCPSQGTAAFQVLRATGFISSELANQDTFDWLGQGVTLGSPRFPSFISKKYLEVFEVEVDTAYGVFRDCNYNSTAAMESCDKPASLEVARLVTRMSAELLEGGPGTNGQCGANEKVGSWFTFPKEGECGSNQSVGAAGCTWTGKLQKAISMSCMIFFNSTVVSLPGSLGFDGSLLEDRLNVPLNESGWYKAWVKDYQKAPFPHVMQHVKNAVNACPDISSASSP